MVLRLKNMLDRRAIREADHQKQSDYPRESCIEQAEQDLLQKLLLMHLSVDTILE